MTKSSKKERPLSNIKLGSDGDASSPTKKMGTPSDKLPPSPTPSTNKGPKLEKDVSVTPPSTGLIISRHKHWRHISAFHGPWLQLPIKILEMIAHTNYNAPRPRLVDPAVVFDVLKIRKAVDEATNFAVVAASDLAPSTFVYVNGGAQKFDPFSHGAKLSGERKLRIRALACQKLAHAYRLDEIACSVATMQGASALEEVGGLVLQRNRDDLNAKYVHFFHEKIPSKRLVETTSLSPLTDMIESAHYQAEALRTRAAVKVFRHEFDGAIKDLTAALALALQRHHVPPHNSSQNHLGPEKTQKHGKERNKDILLPEEDQPSGLVAQLFFQRASVNITMACQHVDSCFDPSPPQKSQGENGNPNTALKGISETQDVSNERFENRRLVKTLAKRALKDYTSFLSYFDYSPNLPTAALCEFSDRVAHAAKGIGKHCKSFEQRHIVYRLSDLFAAVPPPHLPPQETGTQDEARNAVQNDPEPDTSEEVTYHPLLTEALHSLLLCHCLLQTSVKELQRHAYMVARLVRLCHGCPVFLAARAPARSDWEEVLRRTKDWLPLGSTWEVLCDHAPLDGSAANDLLSAAAASLLRETDAGTSSPDNQRGRPLETSSQAGAVDPTVNPVHLRSSTPSYKYDPFRHWNSNDETKNFPFLTDRTIAIVRWIQEVPVGIRTAKKKRRPRKARVKADTVEADMSRLDLNG
ncbi:hypothetical protein H634G_05935 [Metarhizium anisopliae BRIP 53293]|uniref:Histidine kinase group protein n=1 Tax=Metarhizium anisopliae BRIP 53293 TaxID=1291518 RepID=A0A0D9P2T4_METAN|nr:hypothetical protein H634G_05935 [Metarhizium anisopliae BRIP 53293]KJK90148.1 hypothetical protein H633G_05980 [Metarhizium anisopliae BRIP 53284]